MDVNTEKVERVEKKNGADRKTDAHGAAGKESTARLKPLILAELKTGLFGYLLYGKSKLFSPRTENLSVVEETGVFAVFASGKFIRFKIVRFKMIRFRMIRFRMIIIHLIHGIASM